MEHKKLYNKTIELIKVMYDSGFVIDKIEDPLTYDCEILFKHKTHNALRFNLAPYQEFTEDVIDDFFNELVDKMEKGG